MVGVCENMPRGNLNDREDFRPSRRDDSPIGRRALFPEAFSPRRVLFTLQRSAQERRTALSLARYRRATSGDTDDPETGYQPESVKTGFENGRRHPTPAERSRWVVKLRAWLQETDGTLATPIPRGKAVAFTKKQRRGTEIKRFLLNSIPIPFPSRAIARHFSSPVARLKTL